MFIVAGTPGAGKSAVFSLGSLAKRTFNADDRAAELNGGSYRAIPPAVRKLVNVEFETFVRTCIAERQSFALETTLRSTITFEQAHMARLAGFQVIMTYVALDTFESHIARVTQRARRGGHSASETTLRLIYNRRLANLAACLRPEDSGVDELRIYDNSAAGRMPRLVFETTAGQITRLATDLPAWLQTALHWIDSHVSKIREDLACGRDGYSFGA